MPTYEYKCAACQHRFEQFQSMRDKALRKCPACGKNSLERLIGTGAAVIFKGSGFYQTDYRSESYKKAAEAEGKPASSAAGDSTASATTVASAKDSAPAAPPAPSASDRPPSSSKPSAPPAKPKPAKRT